MSDPLLFGAHAVHALLCRHTDRYPGRHSNGQPIDRPLRRPNTGSHAAAAAATYDAAAPAAAASHSAATTAPSAGTHLSTHSWFPDFHAIHIRPLHRVSTPAGRPGLPHWPLLRRQQQLLQQVRCKPNFVFVSFILNLCSWLVLPCPFGRPGPFSVPTSPSTIPQLLMLPVVLIAPPLRCMPRRLFLQVCDVCQPLQGVARPRQLLPADHAVVQVHRLQ